MASLSPTHPGSSVSIVVTCNHAKSMSLGPDSSLLPDCISMPHYAAFTSSFVGGLAACEASASALNPLMMSQKASVTSQAKIGTTPIAAHDKICSETPNIRAAL